ncbi:hypothetical protein NHQ30_009321 [Ciborinia camelliae]|nr:hypothetical protein NHQ30_009321 [Ciborinia camelliae]
MSDSDDFSRSWRLRTLSARDMSKKIAFLFLCDIIPQGTYESSMWSELKTTVARNYEAISIFMGHLKVSEIASLLAEAYEDGWMRHKSEVLRFFSRLRSILHDDMTDRWTEICGKPKVLQNGETKDELTEADSKEDGDNTIDLTGSQKVTVEDDQHTQPFSDLPSVALHKSVISKVAALQGHRTKNPDTNRRRRQRSYSPEREGRRRRTDSTGGFAPVFNASDLRAYRAPERILERKTYYHLGGYNKTVEDSITLFDIDVQRRITSDLVMQLERACFQYFSSLPNCRIVLMRVGWIQSGHAELHVFHRLFEVDHIDPSTLFLIGNESICDFWHLLRKVQQIRHVDAHHEADLPIVILKEMINDAILLTAMLGDKEAKKNIKKILDELEEEERYNWKSAPPIQTHENNIRRLDRRIRKSKQMFEDLKEEKEYELGCLSRLKPNAEHLNRQRYRERSRERGRERGHERRRERGLESRGEAVDSNRRGRHDNGRYAEYFG